MLKILTALIFMTWVTGVSASEIDSFYNRYSPLKDSSQIINEKANEFFAYAIDEANDTKKVCSKKRLYKKLRGYFRNHMTGKLSPWIIRSEEIDKRAVPIRTSIYSKFYWWESFVNGFLAKYISDPSGKVLQMGPYLIGTDKFEHMMGTGYRYFKRAYLKNKGVTYVMNYGRKLEVGYLGAVMTGVFSYGDLVANFNGMRFWNHILSEFPDILGEEYGPYVACENNKWVQLKPINLLDYMDHGWDEGINCSKLRTKNLLRKVLEHLDSYSANDNGRYYGCPMVSQHLKSAQDKYGKLAPLLINPSLKSIKIDHNATSQTE